MELRREGDSDTHHGLADEGEMVARIRTFHWASTPLGAAEAWPASLRAITAMLLENRFPMALWWGRELIHLYNDAYIPVLGDKHPEALARSAPELWREIWHIVGPQTEHVMEGRGATWNEDLFLPMNRKGFVEETYFTFSYSPVRDDAGAIGGVLITCQETTAQVRYERQLRMLRDLGAEKKGTESFSDGESATAPIFAFSSAEEVCRVAAAILSENDADLPFALLYLLDERGGEAKLVGTAGLDGYDGRGRPARVSLQDQSQPWRFAGVRDAGGFLVVEDLVARVGSMPGGRWDTPPQRAVVVGLTGAGRSTPYGFLVAGLNALRPYDDRYREMFRLTADQIVTGIASARAYEEERKRAQALAEIDRAKTAFFSNVSHEFRTPLTLLLGPTEDALDSPERALCGAELESVHRSGLRLLKLVNTLLDFSRIEAGRVDASYEPVDLARLTADLASVFRSATEKAGLSLVVDCPALDEAVYVDREMWEKIVVNLLSNAFKFTFEGGITVSLRRADASAELEVRDTGTGIAAEELPRLFERFHRIKGARARTHEGTGIGLALVQELVKLHRGTIDASSSPGEGTVFKVRIPLGRSHLPSDRIGAPRALATTSVGAKPFVEEALRWLPGQPRTQGSAIASAVVSDSGPMPPVGVMRSERVLLADDNADLRQYLRQLLERYWTVEAVADGDEALQAALQRPPDLILTDIMMPGLDGFDLLRRLRADAATRQIPVILLSARAGEEARVEGIEAGADDYLVKPFSARELVARVRTHLELARMRHEADRAVRQSEERLRLAADAARFGTFDADVEAGTAYWSPEMRAILGLTPEAPTARPGEVPDFVHPEDIESVSQMLRRAFDPAGDGSGEHEHRIVRPDGSVRWVLTRGQVYFAGEGSRRRPMRASGIVLDVTERKQSEARHRELSEALEAERAKLTAAIENLPVGVGIGDPDGTTLTLNSAGLRLHGFQSREDMLTQLAEYARHFELRYQDGRIAPVEEWPVSRATRGEFVRDQEYCLCNLLTGAERIVSYSAAPVHNSRGELILIVYVIQDLTGHKSAQQALRRIAEVDAFRIALADALRPLDGPVDIQAEAARVLGAHLAASGVHYAEVTEDGEYGLVEADYCDDVPSLVGRHRFDDYGAMAMGEFRAGRTLVVADVARDARLTANERAATAALGVGAYVLLPLIKRGRPVAVFVVRQAGPRAWSEAEIALIEETAERTWAAVERAQAEQALRESESRLSAILEQLPVGVGVLDREGAFVLRNALMEAYEPKPMLARDPQRTRYWRASDGEGRLLAQEHWPSARALRGETVSPGIEFIHTAEDGRERWTQVSAVPFRSADQAIIGAIAIAQDITDRKQAELDRDRFFELSVDMLAIASTRDGRWKRLNPAFHSILGWTQKELLEMPFLDILHPEDAASAPQAADCFADGTRLSGFEHRVRCKDGSYRWIAWNTAPYAAEGLMYCVGRDVTDRKLAEQELREADRRKDEFLAVLSHELRNPLSPIRNSLYVLERAEPGGERAGNAQAVIGRQVAHLSRLIDDLLDATRIARGKIQLQKERLDLGDLVRRTVEDHRSAFVARDIALEAFITTQPLWVEGDTVRLSQAVGNLLQNAAKFTRPGGRVEASLCAESETAVLRVHDTGMGIAPEMLERLFEPFMQAQQALDRRLGGLGLGLALVKGFVELHGGFIEAHSEGQGMGSTFTIRLPVQSAIPAAAAAAERAASRGPRRRVLVIEDNLDAAASLREALQLGEHEVVVAHSGPEGIARAREFRPEVVLCDIGLPEMDGYAVARTLRQDETLRSVFLVALTGYALSEDIARAREAGFDRHIAKPTTLEEVERVLTRLG